MQNIHVTGGADFIGSHVAKWLILVTPTREFPFVDAVHNGYWGDFGVKCLADNGIDYDFSKRDFPPFRVRVVEGLKAFIFAVVPNDWIVRVQNAFGFGAKEKSNKGHSC